MSADGPTPYASGKRWTLYGADCLDVLSAGLIPSEAAIITDPPFGMNLNVDSMRFSGGQGHARGLGEDGRT